MKYYNLNNSIVLSFEDTVHTISKDDYRYARIKEALSNQDFDSVKVAVDPTKNLDKDGFVVEDGLVCFKGEPIPSVLGNQFLKYKESSWVFKSLLNFWFNLKTRVDNETASQMINALVENGAYPITEDGFYLVYRNGNADQTKSILNKRNQEVGSINFYNVASVPGEYSNFFYERKNLDDILTSIFGFSAKKLKKIAIQEMFKPAINFVDHTFLLFGDAFKDVLHPDNLYEVLEKKLFKITHGDVSSYRNFNTFLKEYSIEKNGAYSQKKIINLLASAKEQVHLVEIGGYFVDLKEKINLDIQRIQFSNDCQTIFEYLRSEHRKLSDPEIKLNIEENFPEFWELNDVEVGKLRFLFPKTNYDLKEWTNLMQNCIGTHGYDKKVLQKNCVVFALMSTDTNEMIYNIEISNKNIVQFSGRGNRPATQAERKEVCSLLKEKGLIFKE
jgi:hypothetical protein